MKGKRILFLSLVLVLIALMLSGGVVLAALKVTAQPLHAWDWETDRFENGNVNLWTGRWEPMYIQLDTFDDTLVTTACGSTKYAGTATIGLGHTDTNGATGFVATRDWQLVQCNPTAPGVYTPFNCPTCDFHRVAPLDDIGTGSCSGSVCADELINQVYLSIDANCDNIPDTPIPPDGLCIYWEAWSPGPDDPDFTGWWQGNLQARVNDGGGDKTLNFNVAGPNAVTLRGLAATSSVPAFAIGLVVLVAIGAVGLVYRRRIKV